eukprot:TRINITY_DN1041_c0_g1_i1.p1 TRINITY_DN1041_c0_g1~~TRINITY_DN1041_c0_g1_i1.p1  ORF type:complete len:606 (+),score=116.55 TRINITY_DN1041_c0_g1_i1:64-1881(+)
MRAGALRTTSLPLRRLLNASVIKRSTIEPKLSRYCYSTQTLSNRSNNDSENNKTFYVTTPIFYVNGPPHIGHLSSGLLADAMVRWKKLNGRKAFLATGTDEHGSKVEQAAQSKGVSPQQYSDEISSLFRKLFDTANIEYNDFIRTTEPRHITAVQAMWDKLVKSGHIYLGEYKGWYCVSDEAFLGEDEVEEKEVNGIKGMYSKFSQNKVEWVVEKNYMFRLSKFQEPILNWIKENPDVIVPSMRSGMITHILTTSLVDLSVSRPASRTGWGISVPGDPSQVIYVWLDALTNYLTVAGFPLFGTGEKSEKNNSLNSVNTNNNSNNSSTQITKSSDLWPADVHVIGKDIIKFHSIYWPAFLIGAGLPLPKKVLAHAHWTVQRKKMSKSLGNVIDPFIEIEKHGVDPVRYFLLRDGGLVDDGDWSESTFYARFQGDLANTFGNLFARTLSPALNPDKKWPQVYYPSPSSSDSAFISELNKLHEQVDPLYSNGEFTKGILVVISLLYDANKMINDTAPWTMAKGKPNENLDRLSQIIYMSLEYIRICTLHLFPIIPQTCAKIFELLGIDASNINVQKVSQYGYDYSLGNKSGPPSKTVLLFNTKSLGQS